MFSRFLTVNLLAIAIQAQSIDRGYFDNLELQGHGKKVSKPVTNRRGSNGYSIYSQHAFLDIFNWFDSDKDAEVSVRELELVFNLIDVDKDGYIQPSEMDSKTQDMFSHLCQTHEGRKLKEISIFGAHGKKEDYSKQPSVKTKPVKSKKIRA